MPLNPNGKIDRPALPFPTMAELAAATTRGPVDNEEVSLTETEKAMAEVWAKVIPHTTADVRLFYPRGIVSWLNSSRTLDLMPLSLIWVATVFLLKSCLLLSGSDGKR